MSENPNIVFIVSDQLRHDMLGCYGNPVAITPNVDALAAGGTRFANCYSTNPFCLPARAGMITGRYCNQHHCHSNGQVLAPDEPCWPALLRDSGYYTALVGKLHLWEQYRDPPFTPVDHGFQYAQIVEGKASFSSGVEESGWYFDYLSDRGLGAPHAWASDPECRRMAHARISEYGQADHIDGVIGARAARQILEGRKLSRRRDKPFCMQVGLCSPHDAYDPPREFFDMYDEVPDPVFDPEENRAKSPAFRAYVERCAERVGYPLEGYDAESIERIRFMRRCYLATVTFVDHQVGRIVQAMKDAGVYDNTAVILTSDHGEFTGDRGAVQKDYFCYEENLHVPLILHAPFLDAPPGIAEGLVQNMDVFATALDLAGLAPPPSTPSRSLLPMVRDPSATVRDAAFAEHFDRKMVRQGRHKLIVENDPLGTELYDLDADPGETVNLARDPDDPDKPTPDPRALSVMNDLLRRMVRWQHECEGVTYRL